MSDELSEIVDNIREPSVWIRVIFMVLFAITSYLVLLPLILVLSLAQALFTLITGESNANLRYFSATLELYVSQIIKFLTYLSEVKPFPFSDLPEVEDNSLREAASSNTKQQSNSASSGESKSAAPTVKKPATAKTTKKKAAKKKSVKKAATKPVARKSVPDKKPEDWSGSKGD